MTGQRRSPGRGQLLDELRALLDESPSAAAIRERRLLEDIEAHPDRPIVLYGAGNLGRRTQAILAARNLPVEAFIDNDASRWGSDLDGAPIMSSGDATRRFASHAIAIDTIWRAEGGHDHLAVCAELAVLGWKRVESFIPLYWGLGEAALPWLTIDIPTKVLQARYAVLSGATLWSDDRSLREFVQQVRWRLTGDFAVLSRTEPNQYFADGVVGAGSAEVFVDCGAYVGDTMLDIYRRVGSWAAYHAFEPDPDSFASLEAVAGKLPTDVSRTVHLYRAATADRRRIARFAATGLASARLTDDSGVDVQCVSIDEEVQGAAPSFIKMDIEGAEADAISGAVGSIERGRPMLAISAYHKQADLWDLAIQVRALQPDYALYLRPHADEGFDTVLYGIPPERVIGA